MGAQPSQWWKLFRVPLPVRYAFFYAPLASLPILALDTQAYLLVFGGNDYVSWAFAAVLYGVPATCVVMASVGYPAVLVFRRLRVTSLVGWTAADAVSGAFVGSVFPLSGFWSAPNPEHVIWMSLGLVVGAWNAFLLWRANERAEGNAP